MAKLRTKKTKFKSMTIEASYPSVCFNEISSGVHTITGVATSFSAFVGYTTCGLDAEPRNFQLCRF
jgi:hypothetical protein